MDDRPPPPYEPVEPYPLPTLGTLPFPLLTLIISYLTTFLPRSPLDQATTLLWLIKEARLTSRMFYRVIQTHLRNLHLPSYLSHIRPPFSSDPSPPSVDATWSFDPSSFVLGGSSSRRETAILDQFIAARARERCETLESEGFEEMNWREDLFGLYQPQARLLDLLLLDLLLDPPTNPPLPLVLSNFTTSLSLRFTPRKLALFHNEGISRAGGGSRRRELFSLPRERGEPEAESVRRMRETLRGVSMLEGG